MRRNMDLIREILRAVEESTDPMGPDRIIVEGHDEAEVTYHIDLASQAGFLVTVCSMPLALTWKAHEFLEASRNDENWQIAKQLVREATGGLMYVNLIDCLSSMKSTTE